MFSIEYLKEHSNLPGPRGNLELLFAFSRECDERTIIDCLDEIKEDTANSPEEFVGMCGILGYAVLNQNDDNNIIVHLKKYASHHSWRIREAVAMAIQEISVGKLKKRLHMIELMMTQNPYELRAVVAGICEPKLLVKEDEIVGVLEILLRISKYLNHDKKLSEGEKSLRKALGYGWSVVIVSYPDMGKQYFEELFHLENKNIRWIIQENLKKKRLQRMDAEWLKASINRLTSVTS